MLQSATSTSETGPAPSSDIAWRNERHEHRTPTRTTPRLCMCIDRNVTNASLALGCALAHRWRDELRNISPDMPRSRVRPPGAGPDFATEAAENIAVYFLDIFCCAPQSRAGRDDAEHRLDGKTCAAARARGPLAPILCAAPSWSVQSSAPTAPTASGAAREPPTRRSGAKQKAPGPLGRRCKRRWGVARAWLGRSVDARTLAELLLRAVLTGRPPSTSRLPLTADNWLPTLPADY